MKKMMIVMFCLMLVGCQTKEPIEDKAPLIWEGIYNKDNIALTIELENDYVDGFYYTFEYQGKKDQNYADYKNKTTAVSAPLEDGYSLRFTLKKDKVIIEETEGMSYLKTSLAGEYVKE